MPIFLSGRGNSYEGRRKILQNVTKKDSLCLIWHDYPVQFKRFGSCCLSLLEHLLIIRYTAFRRLKWRITSSKKVPQIKWPASLLPSQHHFFVTSLLVSNLNYIITYSSLFSSCTSGTTFFYSMTIKHLESQWSLLSWRAYIVSNFNKSKNNIG